MATLQEVLALLKGVKPIGPDRYQAFCPVHEDPPEGHKASLEISKGEKVPIILCCHATCKNEDIVAAIGLKLSDLMPPRENAGRFDIETTYDYRTADGRVAYQVVRLRNPKDFRQRTSDGNGGWIWKTKDVPKVLYRLPELLAADPDAWVFIVEGEKDVDNLRKLGLVATCNSGGAGKWNTVSDTSALNGRRVCIIADNDNGEGPKHAEDVAARLAGKVKELKVMFLEASPHA